jgi:predicted RNase H-like HicB family nuclease
MKTIASQFVVYIEQDEDGMYIGSIPAIPSCYAEGDTYEEMLKNLTEVVKLCLRNISAKDLPKSRFIGIHNLALTHA